MRASEKNPAQRVAYLERILYGTKSDRLLSKVPENQPGLFDVLFDAEMAEKASEIKAAARQIEKETEKRRSKKNAKPARPVKYNYRGLEERRTVVMPKGVEAGECDIIGRDIVRILHQDPSRMWVEVVERPILRAKADKNQPAPRIWQAPAPRPVIGGGHVAAPFPGQN